MRSSFVGSHALELVAAFFLAFGGVAVACSASNGAAPGADGQGSADSGGTCPLCVTDQDCAATSGTCAQFGSDSYCAAPCPNGNECGQDSACTTVTTADG